MDSINKQDPLHKKGCNKGSKLDVWNNVGVFIEDRCGGKKV